MMTGWFRRLRARIRYRHFARDVASELQFHREMTEDALRGDGVPDREVQWRAARELGNVTLMREDARAVWIAPWLESVWQDVRYALRNLGSHPGFTLAATLTLLLGIGLNTTLFTIFNAILLRPWPVASPSSVVRVIPLSRATRGRSDGVSFAEYRFLRQHARSFSGLVALERSNARIALRRSGDAEYLQACSVSANFFDVLGTGMAAGRGFVAEEGVFGAPRRVAVISDALWRRRFGADPAIVSRTAYINQQPFTIVGVASARFTGPDSARRYDLFIPLPAMPLARPSAHESDFFDNPERCCAELAGRLAPGVGVARATAEIEGLLDRFRSGWKLRPIGVRLTGTANLGALTSAVDADEPRSRRVVGVFSLLFAALFLVLLLACANVGNLQLARALGRRREIGIRLAIGAGRGRVVRQLLTESLLLSLAAGGLAIGLAQILPGAILRLSDPRSDLARVTADGTVLAFTGASALVAALLTGLAPALRATRPGPTMASAGRQMASGGRVRLRSVLLAAQIAATTMLLIGAGLLTRGIANALSSDPGFAVDDVLVAQLTPPAGSDPAALRSGWFHGVVDTLVESGLGPIAVTDIAPLADTRLSMTIRLPGERESDQRRVRLLPASPEYFELLRIPLVSGRPYDARFSAKEVVVNESLARLVWPGEQALGKTLVGDGGSWTVVGVVKDSRVTGFDTVPPLLHRIPSVAGSPLVLLRRGGPDTQARVQATLRRFDDRIVVSIAPLSDSLRGSLRNSISGAAIAWAIGLLGLALALVGVFGVFAYVVEERRREIGIRIALGARGGQVVRMLLAETRAATLGGLLAGLLLSLGVGQLLRRYLFGMSPVDPIAYGGIGLVLLVAAITATYVPARRASRIDPSVTLRCE